MNEAYVIGAAIQERRGDTEVGGWIDTSPRTEKISQKVRKEICA
jgi:hypothetical protein